LRAHFHWFLYKDSFSAISSCIRLNPDWLVQKIISSTPNTECLNDLVYILSNLGKKELWEKCKEKIILNIPESKSRCIAANIEQYRDASEIDKLLGWIPEEHDSLGSASLRALVFISPDLAIENIERLPDSLMYLSRYWYLPLLLEINGEETRGKLLEIIKAKPLDDILFNVYQGNENFMDIATYRFFLRRLTEILRCVLCQGDFNRKILFFLLMLISSCHRLDMLQELGKWRDKLGPLLEELITSIGPRKGIYETNHESRYALAILRRIGGKHWHQIVHMYLASDNHHAHLEGMEWALRIDDSKSLDVVLKISRLEAQSKEEDYEVLKSINVLAATDNINHLVDRLLNIGLHTLNSLWKHTSCLNPFSDESMQQAFRILNTREPKSQLTGSILAIGAGKRFDYSSAVCAILKDEEPGSDIALACILTIQNLKTPINEAVPLLKKHLKNETHRHNVIFALLTISTNEALDLLLDELGNRFDPALASDLCNHKSSSMRSIELTKNYLSKIDSHSRTHLLSEIINNFDDVFLPQVLIDNDIREHISTISLSSHVDPCVIRGLASFNPSLAYIAAKKALLNTDLLNRDRYVPQIVKLDPVKALDDLLRHAPSEPSTWVLYSIGRCLSSITNSDSIFMLLESSDEFVRESACRMLSMWPIENFPVDQLRNMLTDPARRVSLAAIDGLQNYRKMTYTNELVEAIESEKDRVKKWRLLECIAEIADPGDFNNAWPDWRIRVVNVADYAMVSFLNEKLKHRRDDLKQKLNTADSDSGGRRKYAS
jgi:hypothetical protein